MKRYINDTDAVSDVNAEITMFLHVLPSTECKHGSSDVTAHCIQSDRPPVAMNCGMHFTLEAFCSLADQCRCFALFGTEFHLDTTIYLPLKMKA